MEHQRYNSLSGIHFDDIDFLPVFNSFGEGIIIVDAEGIIVYYNKAMTAIDDMDAKEAIGRHITEIYDLTEETSMVLKCIKTGRFIRNNTFYYRTRSGKIANTIHNVFPLYNGQKLLGAICFVKDYNVLEETISVASIPRRQSRHGNGTRYKFDDIVGKDGIFIQSVNTAKMVAQTPSPVMLYGETGTGKELFAQAIHNHSLRSKRTYTPVNCAAIPENLLEGILFGTSRGAFTGAQSKPGLFERANGGTIFLDEINSMPINLQSKILRVIQEKRVRRVGSLREIEIDLKIISSVNRRPDLAIAENTLRPDLFYRLGVVFISIPPLRERKGDIEALVYHFIYKHSRAMDKSISGISQRVLRLFENYHWLGNVRELEHVIEGAINLVKTNGIIGSEHLQTHFTSWSEAEWASYKFADANTHPVPSETVKAYQMPPQNTPTKMARKPEMSPPSLRELQSAREKKTISKALQLYSGNVTRAAQSLEISRQLLHYKMKKHDLKRHDFIYQPPNK